MLVAGDPSQLLAVLGLQLSDAGPQTPVVAGLGQITQLGRQPHPPPQGQGRGAFEVAAQGQHPCRRRRARGSLERPQQLQGFGRIAAGATQQERKGSR